MLNKQHRRKNKIKAGNSGILKSMAILAGGFFSVALAPVSAADSATSLIFPQEPAPFTAVIPEAEKTLEALASTLKERGFQTLELQASDDQTLLRAKLFHPRISDPERVAGRAARILDAYAVESVTTLEICYQVDGVLCDFCLDIPRETLDRFLARMMSHWQLTASIDKHDCSESELLTPSETAAENQATDSDTGTGTVHPDKSYVDHDLLAGLTLWQGNWSRLSFIPVNMEPILNNSGGDPYLGLVSDLTFEVQTPWQIEAAADFRGRWYRPENPDVADSHFHPVRSLIEEYRAQEAIQLEQLYLGFSANLPDDGRLYASVGLQEEMFGGLATQWFYPNLFGNISPELRLDWVKQRDPEEQMGTIDYWVLSGVLAFHWSNPERTLINHASVYGGRFLARDNGVRVEFGHRFYSGAEVSLWLSSTYSEYAERLTDEGWQHSQGLSFSLPLNILREKDTRRTLSASYTGDDINAGQLLSRPVDLSRDVYQREDTRWYRNFGR